ncbi:hypothetical protein V5O39_18970 [Pseudomonas parakoreensis]
MGLTSISLGLVRTLERAGLKVGFFKPIAQPHPGDTGPSVPPNWWRAPTA